MPDLRLTFASTPYDRIEPLLTGEVEPDGITLEYAGRVSLADIFYQQLKFSRFDISEMSFSSFLRARAKGWGYRMLPIFHNRNFAYTTILIRLASGIRPDHPEDLKGKRIGSADYQMTAALWARGCLQHEFGVRPEDMDWYQERSEHFSHGGASDFRPPPGVKFHYAPTDFGTMFLRGELDAAIFYFSTPATSTLDRQRVDLSQHPGFSRLFSDPRQEAIRYFKKTGVFPPHHITVVRESILQEHPWVATSLQNAFEKAKQIAIQRHKERLQRTPSPSSLLVFGMQTLEEQRSVFGDDPYPYGIKANAKAIDMVQTFALEQGLVDVKQPWEELFPEEILLAEEKMGLELPAGH